MTLERKVNPLDKYTGKGIGGTEERKVLETLDSSLVKVVVDHLNDVHDKREALVEINSPELLHADGGLSDEKIFQFESNLSKDLVKNCRPFTPPEIMQLIELLKKEVLPDPCPAGLYLSALIQQSYDSGHNFFMANFEGFNVYGLGYFLKGKVKKPLKLNFSCLYDRYAFEEAEYCHITIPNRPINYNSSGIHFYDTKHCKFILEASEMNFYFHSNNTYELLGKSEFYWDRVDDELRNVLFKIADPQSYESLKSALIHHMPLKEWDKRDVRLKRA